METNLESVFIMCPPCWNLGVFPLKKLSFPHKDWGKKGEGHPEFNSDSMHPDMTFAAWRVPGGKP